jgi:hypothetical protein
VVNKTKLDVLTDKLFKTIEKGECPDWGEAKAAHRRELRKSNAKIRAGRDASPYAEPRSEEDERRPQSKPVTSLRDIKHELDREFGLPPEGEEDVPDEIEIPEEDLIEVDPDLEPSGVEITGETIRELLDRYSAGGGNRHLPLGAHAGRFWKKFDVPVEEIDAALAQDMAKAVYPGQSEELHSEWIGALQEILDGSGGQKIKPAPRRHLLPCRHLICGWVPQRGSRRGSRLGTETYSTRWAAAVPDKRPFEGYSKREQNQTRPDVDRKAVDRAAAQERQRREERRAALLEMPCNKAALQNPELRCLLRREDQLENNSKRGSHLPTHIRSLDGSSAIVNASGKSGARLNSLLSLPRLKLIHECDEGHKLQPGLRPLYARRADGRWSFYIRDHESDPLGPNLKWNYPSPSATACWYYRGAYIGYETKRGRPKKRISVNPKPLAPPPAARRTVGHVFTRTASCHQPKEVDATARKASSKKRLNEVPAVTQSAVKRLPYPQARIPGAVWFGDHRASSAGLI